MPNLYIITGPSGVGKSTVSKELAKRSNKSVLIEGDEIYAHVISGYVSAWKEGNHLDVFWEVCLNMIKTYLYYDYDVIFNYIVTPNIINKIQNEFEKYNAKLVILLADEETLLKRDSERAANHQMKERCITLLNNFKNRNYNKNNVLDSSTLSIDETVTIIQKNNKFIL